MLALNKSRVQYKGLKFTSQFLFISLLLLKQRAASVNIGCSPPFTAAQGLTALLAEHNRQLHITKHKHNNSLCSVLTKETIKSSLEDNSQGEDFK